MISPGAFILLKFWFLGAIREVDGQKTAQNEK